MAHFAMGNLVRSLGRTQAATKHFRNVRSLLQAYGAAEILPDSEGMTAGRMGEIVSSLA